MDSYEIFFLFDWCFFDFLIGAVFFWWFVDLPLKGEGENYGGVDSPPPSAGAGSRSSTTSRLQQRARGNGLNLGMDSKM